MLSSGTSRFLVEERASDLLKNGSAGPRFPVDEGIGRAARHGRRGSYKQGGEAAPRGHRTGRPGVRLLGRGQHNHLPAILKARKMILIAALATNLDALAGCDIVKPGLRHEHIFAEGDLEGRPFGHLGQQ